MASRPTEPSVTKVASLKTSASAWPNGFQFGRWVECGLVPAERYTAVGEKPHVCGVTATRSEIRDLIFFIFSLARLCSDINICVLTQLLGYDGEADLQRRCLRMAVSHEIDASMASEQVGALRQHRETLRFKSAFGGHSILEGFHDLARAGGRVVHVLFALFKTTKYSRSNFVRKPINYAPPPRSRV